MKKILFAGTALALFGMPLLTLAASVPGKVNADVWNPTILAGPLVTCTGDYSQTDGNTTPCQSLCDLIATFENIIYFGIALVIWIFTPIAFAFGGIRFMIARGNPEAVSGAKKILTGTLIGLGIVVCAYLIVSVFVGVLQIAGVGGFGTSVCSVPAASSSQTPINPNPNLSGPTDGTNPSQTPINPNPNLSGSTGG